MVSVLKKLLGLVYRQYSYRLLQIAAEKNWEPITNPEVMAQRWKDVDVGQPLCFFSHFSIDGEINEDVERYLKELHQCGFATYFCSTSPTLSVRAIQQLSPWCVAVLKRKNTGLDFASWSAVYHLIDSQTPQFLSETKAILLANDSVAGPYAELRPLIESIEMRDWNYGGMTDNYFPVYHMQSYFLYLKKEVVRSDAFHQFMKNIIAYRDKKRVILDYEFGLTRCLQNANFKGEALYPYVTVYEIAKERVPWLQFPFCDSTVYFWDLLVLKMGFPFIKRSVLRDNPQNVLRFYDHFKIISSKKTQDVQETTV